MTDDKQEVTLDERVAQLEADRDRSGRVFRAVLRLLLVMLVMIAAGFAYTVWQSYEGRVALVTSQRAGCEHGKLDRKANARGWKSQRDYITGVTSAASVKEDVKAAARVNSTELTSVAAELKERSKVKCAHEFKSPTLWPWG